MARSNGATCFRCSTCGISYPPKDEHSNCDLCGEETNAFSNIKPDDDWKETVESERRRMADESFDAGTARLAQHRYERFTAIGVPVDLALQLAGRNISTHEFEESIRKLVDDGCPLETAIKIVCPLDADITVA